MNVILCLFYQLLFDFKATGESSILHNFNINLHHTDITKPQREILSWFNLVRSCHTPIRQFHLCGNYSVLLSVLYFKNILKLFKNGIYFSSLYVSK